MNVFITGAAGQDGHYLMKALAPEHQVYALYRSQEEARLGVLRIDHPDVNWVRGDVTDANSISGIVRDTRPDWIFNMAAMSFVGLSWNMADLYMKTNAGGTLNVLEAARLWAPEAHIIQASTSEMYGNITHHKPLHELVPMYPASPYGVSKLAAHHLCRVYRESYGMHVSCAISFNHESPLRPESFVTRKITKTVARIAKGEERMLLLGDIMVKRDWGFAGDYVDAYIRMAAAPKPDDYVVATGEAHAVWEFCQAAFKAAGIDSYEAFVGQHQDFIRPNELMWLCGNPAKINQVLGWEPQVTFTDLVEMMVKHDLS